MNEVKEEDRVLKLSDGTEVYIKDPSLKDQREARKVYNKAFKEALESDAYLRSQLNEILMERGLWDEKKQSELTKIEKEIEQYEQFFKKGGKLSEGKEYALKLRELRFKRRLILAGRASYENMCAEGQADNEQFNFLLSQCVLLNDDRKKTYYINYEDYINRGDEIDSLEIANKFAKLFYGTYGAEKELPENKFLVRFKMVNDKLELVNEDGHRVDREEKLIDEEGNWISYDEEGNSYKVDKEGNKLEEEVEAVFTDDEGNVVE